MKKFLLTLLIILAAFNLQAQSAYSIMEPYFSSDAKSDLVSGNESRVWQDAIGGKFSGKANNVYLECTDSKFKRVSYSIDGSYISEKEMPLLKLSDDIYMHKKDEKEYTKRIIILYNYALFTVEVQTYKSPYSYKSDNVFFCGTNKKYGEERSFVAGYGKEWEQKSRKSLADGTYFNSNEIKNKAYDEMLAVMLPVIEDALNNSKNAYANAERLKKEAMEKAASDQYNKIKEENEALKNKLIEKFGEPKLFATEYNNWKDKGWPKLTAFYTNSGYFKRLANSFKATDGYIDGDFEAEFGKIIYQGSGLETHIYGLKNETEGQSYLSIKHYGEFDRADNWYTHTNFFKFKRSFYWDYNAYLKTKIEGTEPIGAIFWIKGNLIYYSAANANQKIYTVYSYPEADTLSLKSPNDYFELSNYFRLVVLPEQRKVELK